MKHCQITNSKNSLLVFLLFVLCFMFSFFYIGCIGMAATAEEYYSIGMAYFELGKFEDAERWLIRARQADRTYVASQYNLGRLAFENKRFEEAARHFEGILRRDPDNVLALRASAYTRIRLGHIDIAQRHYTRLLQLIPESADDGYNHALVLYAMGRYSEAETVLERYPFALQDNKDIQLLFARSQAAQNKIEAIDSFANWLEHNTDIKAHFEYARILEYHEFYARSLEELRKVQTAATATSTDPSQNEIRFAIARVLLIAEAESNAGITEMQGAVTDGFNDIEAIEELMNNPKISRTNVEALRGIVTNIQRAILAEQEQQRLEEEQNQETVPEESVSETDSETGSQ
jgi:tetratricopeptide (TPR) repeat protein